MNRSSLAIAAVALLPLAIHASPEDETLASSFVYCAQIAHFLGPTFREEHFRQDANKKYRVYLGAAVALTSEDFVEQQVPLATKRLLSSMASAASAPAGTPLLAHERGTMEQCFKDFNANLNRLGEKADQKSQPKQ